MVILRQPSVLHGGASGEDGVIMEEWPRLPRSLRELAVALNPAQDCRGAWGLEPSNLHAPQPQAAEGGEQEEGSHSLG